MSDTYSRISPSTDTYSSLGQVNSVVWANELLAGSPSSCFVIGVSWAAYYLEVDVLKE